MNLYAAWVFVALMESYCEGYREIYRENIVLILSESGFI